MLCIFVTNAKMGASCTPERLHWHASSLLLFASLGSLFEKRNQEVSGRQKSSCGIIFPGVCYIYVFWEECVFRGFLTFPREGGFPQAVAQVNLTALNTLLLLTTLCSFLAFSFIFFLPSSFKPLVDCFEYISFVWSFVAAQMHPCFFCEASNKRMHPCMKLTFAPDASICVAKKLRCILSFSLLSCEARRLLAAYS